MEELALKPTEKVNKTYTSNDELRQQSPFMPTYIEWLRKHSEHLSRYVYTSNLVPPGVSLYEVPKNKTLFITSAFISQCCLGPGAAALRQCFLTIDNDFNKFILSTCIFSLGAISNQQINYNSPLIVPSGANITFANSTDSRGQFQFDGFLIENSLIPQF